MLFSANVNISQNVFTSSVDIWEWLAGPNVKFMSFSSILTMQRHGLMLTFDIIGADGPNNKLNWQ